MEQGSVALHMCVILCCEFCIPQFLTHLCFARNCRSIILDVRRFFNSWQLQLHLIPTLFAGTKTTGVLLSSCSSAFSFLPRCAGRLPCCPQTAGNMLGFELVTVVLQQFSLSQQVMLILIAGTCVQVPLQRSSRLQGGIFYIHLLFQKFSLSSREGFTC